jgi:hypothetical protein
MVTRIICNRFRQMDGPYSSRDAQERGQPQCLRNLLILIEGEHVYNVAFAVDQQDSPTVDDALQIAGQLGQLIFTSQGQRLRCVLNILRQASAATNLPLSSCRQVRALCRSGRQV